MKNCLLQPTFFTRPLLLDLSSNVGQVKQSQFTKKNLGCENVSFNLLLTTAGICVSSTGWEKI